MMVKWKVTGSGGRTMTVEAPTHGKATSKVPTEWTRGEPYRVEKAGRQVGMSYARQPGGGGAAQVEIIEPSGEKEKVSLSAEEAKELEKGGISPKEVKEFKEAKEPTKQLPSTKVEELSRKETYEKLQPAYEAGELTETGYKQFSKVTRGLSWRQYQKLHEGGEEVGEVMRDVGPHEKDLIWTGARWVGGKEYAEMTLGEHRTELKAGATRKLLEEGLLVEKGGELVLSEKANELEEIKALPESQQKQLERIGVSVEKMEDIQEAAKRLSKEYVEFWGKSRTEESIKDIQEDIESIPSQYNLTESEKERARRLAKQSARKALGIELPEITAGRGFKVRPEPERLAEIPETYYEKKKHKYETGTVSGLVYSGFREASEAFEKVPIVGEVYAPAVEAGGQLVAGGLTAPESLVEMGGELTGLYEYEVPDIFEVGITTFAGGKSWETRYMREKPGYRIGGIAGEVLLAEAIGRGVSKVTGKVGKSYRAKVARGLEARGKRLGITAEEMARYPPPKGLFKSKAVRWGVRRTLPTGRLPTQTFAREELLEVPAKRARLLRRARALRPGKYTKYLYPSEYKEIKRILAKPYSLTVGKEGKTALITSRQMGKDILGRYRTTTEAMYGKVSEPLPPNFYLKEAKRFKGALTGKKLTGIYRLEPKTVKGEKALLRTKEIMKPLKTEKSFFRMKIGRLMTEEAGRFRPPSVPTRLKQVPKLPSAVEGLPFLEPSGELIGKIGGVIGVGAMEAARATPRVKAKLKVREIGKPRLREFTEGITRVRPIALPMVSPLEEAREKTAAKAKTKLKLELEEIPPPEIPEVGGGFGGIIPPKLPKTPFKREKKKRKGWVMPWWYKKKKWKLGDIFKTIAGGTTK